jgi:hypothetical protein
VASVVVAQVEVLVMLQAILVQPMELAVEVAAIAGPTQPIIPVVLVQAE